MCAGPFSFVERVPQDHVTLERFPQYWDSKDIHFDRVIYQVIVDSSVRLANLKAGAIDLAEYIVPTDVAAVKADPKLRLVVSDALGYVGITNNLANGPRADNPYGQDALVRQAFEPGDRSRRRWSRWCTTACTRRRSRRYRAEFAVLRCRR